MFWVTETQTGASKRIEIRLLITIVPKQRQISSIEIFCNTQPDGVLLNMVDIFILGFNTTMIQHGFKFEIYLHIFNTYF